MFNDRKTRRQRRARPPEAGEENRGFRARPLEADEENRGFRARPLEADEENRGFRARRFAGNRACTYGKKQGPEHDGAPSYSGLSDLQYVTSNQVGDNERCVSPILQQSSEQNQTEQETGCLTVVLGETRDRGRVININNSEAEGNWQIEGKSVLWQFGENKGSAELDKLRLENIFRGKPDFQMIFSGEPVGRGNFLLIYNGRQISGKWKLAVSGDILVDPRP